jgi:hypothetical protein
MFLQRCIPYKIFRQLRGMHINGVMQGLKAAEEDAQFLYWQTLGSRSIRGWHCEASKRQHLRRLYDICATRQASQKARHVMHIWRAWALRRCCLRRRESQLRAVCQHRTLAHAFQVWRTRVRHLQQQIQAVMHASRLYLGKAFGVWRRSASKSAAVRRAVGFAELTLQLRATAVPGGPSLEDVFCSWRSLAQVRSEACQVHPGGA